MFDPTAFENLKVVMEGAIYDLDLAGEISIVDRNDIFNMAKLLRSYDMSFTMMENKACTCTIYIEADLENLAAELLSSAISEKLAGCRVTVKFSMEHDNSLGIHEKMINIVKDVWGIERNIEQKVFFDPLTIDNIINKEVFVNFDRLIYEDQIDDLVAMVDYMTDTLKRLNFALS